MDSKDLYYIEGADSILKKLSRDNTNLPTILGENVMQITPEQLPLVLQAIKDLDYIEDEKFKEYIEGNFPLFSKHVRKTPIKLVQFKDEIKKAYSEIPDEYFEETNTLIALKKILNFLIKKNEFMYSYENINNGRLRYDGRYQYPKVYQFYFRMIKLNWDLDVYFPYIVNLQRSMERAFVNDLYFSDRQDISRKDLNLFREAHNAIGKNLYNFKDVLEDLRERIVKEKTFIKRTTIIPPAAYWEEEKKLSQKIESISAKLEVELQKTSYRKEQIEKFMKEKEGIFTKENLKLLIEALDLGDWLK